MNTGRSFRRMVFAAVVLMPLGARGGSLVLVNGDNATVNAAGTTGTIGGVMVSNSVNTYGDKGELDAISVTGNSDFTLGSGATLLNFDSDLLYAPDYAICVNALGSGTVRVTGGTLSHVNQGTLFSAGGTGQNYISGGYFSFSNGADETHVSQAGRGPLSISGGTFDLTNSAPSRIAVYATRYFDPSTLMASASGIVSITGGNFLVSPGAIAFDAELMSTINLFSQNGAPFLIDGVPMNNQTLPLMTGIHNISGTLADGESLDATFYNAGGGTIGLNVPEPASLSVLALGAVLWSALRRHPRTGLRH